MRVIDLNEGIKKYGTVQKYLNVLAEKYYFHGSPNRVNRLLPRQAKNAAKKRGETLAGVYVTPHPSIAFFHAILPTKIKFGFASWGVNARTVKINFAATPTIKLSSGFIYLIPKKNNALPNLVESRSEIVLKGAVRPAVAIRVFPQQFPEKIKNIPMRKWFRKVQVIKKFGYIPFRQPKTNPLKTKPR